MPQVNTNLTVLNLKLRHANVTQMSALPLIVHNRRFMLCYVLSYVILATHLKVYQVSISVKKM